MAKLHERQREFAKLGRSGFFGSVGTMLGMATQEHDPQQQHPYSKLWRIRTAAAVAGLSPKHFKAGVDSGAIPVEIVRIGRFEHVRAAQLAAWLFFGSDRDNAGPAPDCADLFQPLAKEQA